MSERPLAFVLDDQASILEAVRQLLEANGFEVRCSLRWSEIAQRLVAERRPAVFVCDLSLVGIRGEDLCRTLLGVNKAMSIVLFSADRAELQAACMRLSVSGVCKADGLPRLLAEVRKLSGGPASSVAPAQPLPPPPKTPPRGSYLVGDGIVGAVEVTRAGVRVGRAAEAAISLPHDSVSKHHADVRLEGEEVVVTDRSRNGCWIDGVQVRGKAALPPGACLEVGPFSLTLLADVTREEAYQPKTENLLQINLPGAKLSALLVFVASAGLSGRITSSRRGEGGQAETQSHRLPGTLDVHGERLVAARLGKQTGVAAALAILRDLEAIVRFHCLPVGAPAPDAPRLLDLLGSSTADDTQALRSATTGTVGAGSGRIAVRGSQLDGA